jgi:hypothetical protein
MTEQTFRLRIPGRTEQHAISDALRITAQASIPTARYTTYMRAWPAGPDLWDIEIIDIDGEGPDQMADRYQQLGDIIVAMRADQIDPDPTDLRARLALRKLLAARPSTAQEGVA